MSSTNEPTRSVVIGGVDTHKDLHVAAVVDRQDRVIGSRSFASTRQGYRQMLAWMRSFGELQRVGVEPTGSYGAGLLRFLQQAGVTVLEVTAPDRQDRRKRGKSDDLDAQNAAHAAFSGPRTVTPRSRDGMIEALRVLVACRKTAVTARRVALQMIHNTIVAAPDGLRDLLRAMTRMQLVRTLAAWRPDLTAYRDVEAAYRISLKSLGRRYLELHDEIADLDAMIGAIVEDLAPNLIARNSISHVGAAQLLLTAGGNPERMRSEASFAALCGVSPVPAHPARRSAIGSIEAVIVPPTAPCTSSPLAGCARINEPRSSSPDALQKATPNSTQSAPSNAISLVKSLCSSCTGSARSTRRASLLDKQKGVQGSQFTSPRFTEVLAEAGVRISMDGRGRWLDNVFIERLWRSLKYECIYLNAFETGSQARAGIGRWITYYNGSRPHTALGGRTPAEVHTAPAGIELAA